MVRHVNGILALVAVIAMSSQADARYLVTLAEQGSDVVATGAGTINTGSFGALFDANDSSAPFVQGGTGTLLTGSPTFRFNAFFVTLNGAPSFGTGIDLIDGAGSGSPVYINAGGALGVPVGYFSGTLLSSRAIFAGQSLATLKLIPGTYNYSFGAGASADSFSVVIGDTPLTPAVPEPSSWIMLLLGFVGMGHAMRRRAKVRANVSFA